MPVSRVDKEATERRQNELKAASEQLAMGAGLALWHWSLVEATLTYLFVSVLDRSRKPVQQGLLLWQKEHPQRRMFHTLSNAIISFEVRVDMTGAAVAESDLRKDLKKLWPGIATRLKKGYKSRHEAAHFLFDEVRHRDGSATMYLSPFPTTVASFADKRLTRAQLDHKAERFDELSVALGWFRRAVEIQRRREKAPRTPEPALIQRVRQSLKTQTQEAPE